VPRSVQTRHTNSNNSKLAIITLVKSTIIYLKIQIITKKWPITTIT